MTPTPEEVAALVKRLIQRSARYGGESNDEMRARRQKERDEAAYMIAALQARAEAAEARVREVEADRDDAVRHWEQAANQAWAAHDRATRAEAIAAALTPASDTPAR